MSVIEKKNLSITYSGNLPALPYEKIKDTILGPTFQLSVSFVVPKEAKRLNKTYRQKTYIPNTLSFPLSKNSGQLIICRSIARHQAKDFELSYKNYLIYLLNQPITSIFHKENTKHFSKFSPFFKSISSF